MKPAIKITIIALFVIGIGVGLYFIIRKKDSSSEAHTYSCHNWTPAEQAQIDSGVPQYQVCENGGNIFTQGANQNYPGCKTCWCCHKES